MYSIGDKVVYPMHGAGVIQSIEEKEVLGLVRAYYIMRMPYGNMQVMVPVDTCLQVGLRPIGTPQSLESVMEVLHLPSTEMDENWNRRLRDNTEKLKTGNPKEVAGVIRNLVRVERVKKLSAGEKKLLTNARQILASEIVLITGCGEEEAFSMIDCAI